MSEPLHVLVVDMSVGFSERGALSSPRVGAIVPEMAEFLRSLPPAHHLSDGGAGSEVVFIGDLHRPGDPELTRFPEHCMERSGEDAIRPELILACAAAGIVPAIHYKKEHDGFVDDAGPYLQSAIDRRSCFRLDCLTKDSDEWVVVGCVTDICVDLNVGALVMRGKRVTVVRSLIDTYDLPLERCRELGLPDHAAHDADRINEFWFGHRFPALWGARVAADWRELL